jgi:hypothetical protein
MVTFEPKEEQDGVDWEFLVDKLRQTQTPLIIVNSGGIEITRLPF